jgi:predicted nuclease of predicted toxin-antitoxin system
MKLLFDQNLSFRLCRQVADLFPGSLQARLAGLERASDRALWDHAGANRFMLVSLDADFAEMAALLGPPPKLIWLRCGNQPTAAIEILLRDHAEAIAAFEHDEAACLEIYERYAPR